ncbi:hypothetical protein QQP08_017626, partial [Theobroma cacao]
KRLPKGTLEKKIKLITKLVGGPFSIYQPHYYRFMRFRRSYVRPLSMQLHNATYHPRSDTGSQTFPRKKRNLLDVGSCLSFCFISITKILESKEELSFLFYLTNSTTTRRQAPKSSFNSPHSSKSKIAFQRLFQFLPLDVINDCSLEGNGCPT